MGKHVFALVPALLLALTPAAHAGEVFGVAGDKVIAAEREVFYKLGDGVSNLASGWIELPFHLIDEPFEAYSRNRSLAAGLFAGLFIGVTYTALRTGIGAFQVLTFPAGDLRFEPLIEPLPHALQWGGN